MHEHSWYFTLQPARWTATCGCDLAVTFETPMPGRSTWAWRLDVETPPADVMLVGIGSVTRARPALLAARLPERS